MLRGFNLGITRVFKFFGNKKTRESERKVTALLKLLESTQAATDKFLAGRVKDAVKAYGIAVAPKRRRKRRVAKKKVVKQ